VGASSLRRSTGISINDQSDPSLRIRRRHQLLPVRRVLDRPRGRILRKGLHEREDLVGLQYNRIPTLNRYLYGAALNLGYVPVYGKFALFNRTIIPWEIFASAAPAGRALK